MHTKRDWSDEEAAQFYAELLARALSTIPAQGAAMVLGPMFIIRPPEENFRLFASAQARLVAQGIVVFDQLPLLDYNLPDAPFKYAIKFEKYYKPLIQSGKITVCYLLPDWEQSPGTRSEISFAEEAGVPVFEIPK